MILAAAFLTLLTTQDNASNVLTYGSPDPHIARHPRAPVVRLIGVDATFTKQSYLPAQVGALNRLQSLKLRKTRKPQVKSVNSKNNRTLGAMKRYHVQ